MLIVGVFITFETINILFSGFGMHTYLSYEILMWVFTVLPLTSVVIPLLFFLKQYHNHEYKQRKISIIWFYIFELISAAFNFTAFLVDPHH